VERTHVTERRSLATVGGTLAISNTQKKLEKWIQCQAKFLTSRHVRMHWIIFCISNTSRKLMI